VSEDEDGFDDAKDGFDGLFSFFVEGFSMFALQFGFHLDAPRVFDGFGRLLFGAASITRWWPKVIGPVGHGASDGDKWGDAFVLECFDLFAAGIARIG
jgi:hypothetical protein